MALLQSGASEQLESNQEGSVIPWVRKSLLVPLVAAVAVGLATGGVVAARAMVATHNALPAQGQVKADIPRPIVPFTLRTNDEPPPHTAPTTVQMIKVAPGCHPTQWQIQQAVQRIHQLAREHHATEVWAGISCYKETSGGEGN